MIRLLSIYWMPGDWTIEDTNKHDYLNIVKQTIKLKLQ